MKKIICLLLIAICALYLDVGVAYSFDLQHDCPAIASMTIETVDVDLQNESPNGGDIGTDAYFDAYFNCVVRNKAPTIVRVYNYNYIETNEKTEPRHVLADLKIGWESICLV